MSKKKNKVSLESTLKSMDTEEWLDLKFYRPIGYQWALFFKKFGVSPNTITILSIFIGITAGVLFYFPDLKLNLIGMLCLIWANSYDSADGQLARMTKQYSRIGRILDGVSGDFWFIAIYMAICLRLYNDWGLWIWILAAAAGECHSIQAASADYLRNFHLFFVKGKNGSELDDSNTVKEQAKALKWKGNFVEKFFMLFYVPYTKSQERRTPKMQAFRKTLEEKFGEEGPTQEFSEAFRKESKPFMKYTNILSFNTRVIALFICLFINEPWLYFVFELVILNSLLIYMSIGYERLCKRFDLRLRGNA